jgi:hypothetical protein
LLSLLSDFREQLETETAVLVLLVAAVVLLAGQAVLLLVAAVVLLAG